jgi:hypothetical protein
LSTIYADKSKNSYINQSFVAVFLRQCLIFWRNWLI